MLKNYDASNYKQVMLEYTHTHIECFFPKTHAYDFDDHGQEILLHKPTIYKDYEELDGKNKKEAYRKCMQNNRAFKLYVEGLNRMRNENISLEIHLRECIKTCEELGDDYDKQKNVFIGTLMKFGGGDG